MPRNSTGRTTNKTTVVTADINQIMMLNRRISPDYFGHRFDRQAR
jgi:hypothetical protein